MIYFLLVAALIAAFLLWRITSVGRGARQRDARIFAMLDPIAERFERKEEVRADEVAALAARPELRPILYAVLGHHERLDLFPREALTLPEDARAKLAYWMMHPNELQDAPQAIEPVTTLSRRAFGKEAQFIVLRYRMPAGHWAGSDWILGLAGPYFPGAAPYENEAGGFSRASDREGTVTPDELADWYAGVLDAKFARKV